MAEKLLPCPFCGGRAERVDIEDSENAGGSCISCTKCQASSNVEFEFKENFVSNWNRRTTRRRVMAEWQPIETAPRNGTPVLLWKASTREHYVAAKLNSANGPGWCTPDGFEIFRATHWQPLPEPPATGANP